MIATPATPASPLPMRIVKVLVVGGPETGKTSLLQCYNGSHFDEVYTPTTKSDLIVKELKIGNTDVSAQLWDIGGSSPMGKSFLRGTNAIVLVADLTSCGSMDGLDAIYERVKLLAGFADDSFPCALVGNKLDLVGPEGSVEHGREISLADLRLWAKARRPHNPDSISFYEASAKTGANVQETFENIVCLAFSRPAKHLSTPAASGTGSIYAGSEISSGSKSRTPGTGSAPPLSTISQRGAKSYSTPAMSLSGVIETHSSFRGTGGADGVDVKDDLATAKVVIAGSPRVGKTCILRRFVGDDAQATLDNYEPTLGADFRLARMPVSDGNKTLALQLWDTAGDERMATIGRSIYKNADCLVLVYDITDRNTFEALKLYWSNYVLYGRPFEPDEFPCVLVGNKCDLGDRRAVPLEEVLDWCTYQRPSKPITYMECSALRAISVRDIFVCVSDAIYDYSMRVDGQGTDDDTEDTYSVYTTDTGGTETGNDSHLDARRGRSPSGGGGRVDSEMDRRDRAVRAIKTPKHRGGGVGGDDSLEQSCWMFSCIGL